MFPCTAACDQPAQGQRLDEDAKMKAVRFSSFGRASEVAELVDMPSPPAPGPGEALIAVEVAPINPSDLLYFEGHYAKQPSLPAMAGGGVLGRIAKLADDVRHLKVGERVIVVNTARAGWCERFVWPAALLVPLPDADAIELALLAANPPTALLMLERFVHLKPGDWVIQNAANSSVGVSLIQIAKTMGLRTVNVVRRAKLVDYLRGFGADVTLVDTPNLRDRVIESTGTASIKLGIDAVAGEATRRLANCLGDGAMVVNYGLLSGMPCEVDPADVLFRDISLRGFWYTRWLASADPNAVKTLFERLVGMLQAKTLHVPLEASYPIERLNEALAHAERQGRHGKIVLRWNG
jgi:mitochondrial enoyl-[acyl-carrier protein] reductase / trans-2-enoyl-CoA reductase